VRFFSKFKFVYNRNDPSGNNAVRLTTPCGLVSRRRQTALRNTPAFAFVCLEAASFDTVMEKEYKADAGIFCEGATTQPAKDRSRLGDLPAGHNGALSAEAQRAPTAVGGCQPPSPEHTCHFLFIAE
ncbi:MAG: hypothetical protein ACYC21_10890, partial [Eubacteriales bacterium]